MRRSMFSVLSTMVHRMECHRAHRSVVRSTPANTLQFTKRLGSVKARRRVRLGGEIEASSRINASFDADLSISLKL